MISIETICCYGPWEKIPDKFPALLEAMSIIDDILADPTFDGTGKRNDNGVNLAIALHVLGCSDPTKWYEEYRGSAYYDIKFKEKLETVKPYLKTWGPKGIEEDALNYVID